MLEVRDLVVNYGAIQAVRGCQPEPLPPARSPPSSGPTVRASPRCCARSPAWRRYEAARYCWTARISRGFPPSRRAALGLAHAMEGRRIFRQLSVEENLQLAWQFGRRRNTWDAALARVFATFPVLREKRRVHAGLLSGGQQQMMIVSSATICDPSYLLLDEPSLGLAPIIVNEIYAFFTQRCHEEGTTVLLAEQMAALALKVSAHGYVFRQGPHRPGRSVAGTGGHRIGGGAFIGLSLTGRIA